jgi:hypothetical protein
MFKWFVILLSTLLYALALSTVFLWWLTEDEPTSIWLIEPNCFAESYGWLSIFALDARFNDYRASVAVHYWQLGAAFAGLATIMLIILIRRERSRSRQAQTPATSQ